MNKRIFSLILATLMVAALLAGCTTATNTDSGGAATATTQPTQGASTPPAGNEGEETTEPTQTADERPFRDLGGMAVTIANWWSNSDDLVKKAADKPDELTKLEEATLDYRNDIQEKYNVSIKNINLCGWGEMQELCAAAIMSGSPDSSIYVLDSGWIGALLTKGLFYDVSTLPSYQDALKRNVNEKWNLLVENAMTFNGKTYGFATGYEPRTGLFFNKRLLQEAGYDPEYPYDMQAAGTWTWTELEELAKATTRDTDQDGTNDTYGFATFSSDYTAAIVFSNDASFVRQDENGMYSLAIDEPNFVEALNFARKLSDQGYVLNKTEADDGVSWDWFIQGFAEGQAAMRVAEEYAKGQMKPVAMVDDWGFATFPRGPKGTGASLYRENTLIIPYTFTAEEADNIFYAYDLWTDPIPGYEDSEDWKIAAYAEYRDERAVDETLAVLRKGANGVLRSEGIVFTNDSFGSLVWDIWNTEFTPSELVEKVRVEWTTLVDEANTKIAGLK